MYVVSIVAYHDSDFQDRYRPHKMDFHTRGTECACAQQYIVQEVELGLGPNISKYLVPLDKIFQSSPLKYLVLTLKRVT